MERARATDIPSSDVRLKNLLTIPVIVASLGYQGKELLDQGVFLLSPRGRPTLSEAVSD